MHERFPPDAMIPLLLSRDLWQENEYEESGKLLIPLLQKLESVIISVISSEGKSEARLWLCKAIASINCFTPNQRCEFFMALLRSKHLKKRVSAQLLQMLFDKAPQKVGRILAKKSYMLETFFKGHPDHISAWFSGNASAYDLELRNGIKALAQFAFVNRDICWDELEWKGKHGQSPAVVATKPHYFLDLDIQRTVENFVEYVPEFWSSKEFADSLSNGQIVYVDTRYFKDFLARLMYEEDSKEVWDAVSDFLMQESFVSLCNHTLIILEEQDFPAVLKLLHKFLKPVNPITSSWLEIVLLVRKDWDSIEELLVLNTVINQGRQLLRRMQDEEFHSEESKVHQVVLQINANSAVGNALPPIARKYFRTKTVEVIKWMGLQSWAIHYRLSKEGRSTEFWESLFVNNGISSRKLDRYTLLSEDWQSDGKSSTLNEIRNERKKKGGRRKKKRRVDFTDSSDDEPSYNVADMQPGTGVWYLSTNGYSTLWSNVDLPEHIANHCFCTWLKWVSTLGK